MDQVVVKNFPFELSVCPFVCLSLNFAVHELHAQLKSFGFVLSISNISKLLNSVYQLYAPNLFNNFVTISVCRASSLARVTLFSGVVSCLSPS